MKNSIATIDVANLRKIGKGEECDVYQFARLQVIKCFREDSSIRANGSHPWDIYKAQRLLASFDLAPPVYEFVKWKRGKESGYGYISAKAFKDRKLNPEDLELSVFETLKVHLDDIHEKNIGVYKGKPVIIDCGFDALKIIEAAACVK